MSNTMIKNPCRFPKNAEGPFYTTGCFHYPEDDPKSTGKWYGNCMWCEAPEAEAPELMAPLKGGNTDTYFLRQPENEEETEHAISAAQVCCVYAVRYGGQDPSIIKRLNNDPAVCDYFINRQGQLIYTLDEQGELLPFAMEIAQQRINASERKHRSGWQLFRRITRQGY